MMLMFLRIKALLTIKFKNQNYRTSWYGTGNHQGPREVPVPYASIHGFKLSWWYRIVPYENRKSVRGWQKIAV